MWAFKGLRDRSGNGLHPRLRISGYFEKNNGKFVSLEIPLILRSDFVFRLDRQSRYQRPAMVSKYFPRPSWNSHFHRRQKSASRKRTAFRTSTACARSAPTAANPRPELNPWMRRIESHLRRFGDRAVEVILRARRAARFKRNQKYRHEHQIRVLGHRPAGTCITH